MTGHDKYALRWGESSWRIDFRPSRRMPPREVDVAVIGGGFTGLAAACHLRRLAPEKTVALLEARYLGSGASGRTGGIVLAGTAHGELPGLGDVLQGFVGILEALEIDCGLTLPGVWEIARTRGQSPSPIRWKDSGALQVLRGVAGGTVAPDRLIDGLASAAERLGVVLCESAPVLSVTFEQPAKLVLAQSELQAHQVVFATNAHALHLSGLAGRAESEFALAVATEPFRADVLEAIGLGQRNAFYTVDLPYLWGRVLPNGGIVFGSGLVPFDPRREWGSIDIRSGQAARLLADLEERVRGLHPALRSVRFTHRWGGPILFPESGNPFFARHARSPCGLILGGYSGHGVALSVYLGCWAAEVLLGRRRLPSWSFEAS
jgi:glycine/D-amino acid oxidase-like deaminating enzyme